MEPTGVGRDGARHYAALIARLLTRTVLGLAVITLVGLGLGPFTGRYRVVTVLSGSMRPTAPIGAVVISTPEPLESVRVGQVISFRAPTPGGPVETHRVIKIVSGGANPLVRTQGDANARPDPWVARLATGPVWKARVIVPGVGTMIHSLRAPLVRRLMLFGAPACFVLVALAEIWGLGATREEPAPA